MRVLVKSEGISAYLLRDLSIHFEDLGSIVTLSSPPELFCLGQQRLLLPAPTPPTPAPTPTHKSKLYRCCAPNASMCPPSNGSGPVELEKSHHAPPTIAIQTSDDVPDAGLRSLDHCEFSCAATVPRTSSFFLLLA